MKTKILIILIVAIIIIGGGIWLKQEIIRALNSLEDYKINKKLIKYEREI